MEMGVVEEGSFPDTAGNLENKEKATLVKQAEVWLRIDGLLHRATELFGEWKTKMAHWTDETPPPDPERKYKDTDFADLAQAIATAGAKAAAQEYARRGNVQFGNYGDDGGSSWNKWIVPGLVTLAVSGVIGNVVQYAEVASLKTAFTDFAASMERRVNNLEQRVYRGSQ